MKLGELFVQLGVQGDTKELKKTLADMEKADKLSNIELKKRKALKEATTAEDKALIQETADRKKEIVQTKDAIGKKEALAKAARGVVGGIMALATAALVVYHAVDRMTNALVKANASMITFNRTTGIGFGSLNKYASASMAVNPNASIEGTAQTMQNLAQNLYDIRMGRGDISPYQELAFVGGRPFNPMGMNVEQVIESVREAIKGVDDIQATNIITRMGFSPEDLQMLRMSREELEGIQSLFLNSAEREEIQRLGIEYKKLQLQTQLYWQRGLIQMIPALLKVMNFLKGLAKQITDSITLWAEAFDRVTDFAKGLTDLIKGCEGLTAAIKGLSVAFGALFVLQHPFIALYLILEDIVGYFLGWNSVIIPALKMFGDFLVGWINGIGDKIKEKGGWIYSIANIMKGLGNIALHPSIGTMAGAAVLGPVGGLVGGGINALEGMINGQSNQQPVPVGQSSNVTNSTDNRTSNINQTNNFRISALPEDMAGAVGDRLSDVSFNSIIAQNIPQAV